MPRPTTQRIDGIRVADPVVNRQKRQVVANPTLAVNPRPAPSETQRLGAALSELSPRISELLTDRGAQKVYDQEVSEQNAGKAGFLKGESKEGKSEAWARGYMHLELKARAYEDLAAFEQDYLTNFDKDHGDFKKYSSEWWKQRTAGLESDPRAFQAYIAAVTPGIAKVQGADYDYKTTRIIERQNSNAMTFMESETRKLTDSGKPVTAADLDRMRDELKANMPLANKDYNSLAFDVASRLGQEGNFQVFEAFKQPHADGTPGMYFIPEWRQKIDAAQIHAQNVYLNNQRAAAEALEKERKAQTQMMFRSYVKTAIAGEFNRALLEFDAASRDDTWPATASETIDLRNSLMQLKTKQEESSTQHAYATSLLHDVWSLKISDPSVITQAAVIGRITWEKAEALTSDIMSIEQNRRQAEREGRESLDQLYRDPRVVEARSIIQQAMAADALQLGPDREQRAVSTAAIRVEMMRKLADGTLKPDGVVDWAQKTANMYRTKINPESPKVEQINPRVEQGKAAAKAKARPEASPETIRLLEAKEAYGALLRAKPHMSADEYRREKAALDAIYRPK